MKRFLHNLAVGICSLVYALVGLVFGVCTGFIVVQLIQLIFGVTMVSPAVRWAVAGWAIVLAVFAASAYLRSPAGDRFSRGES
ncbi:hypothetical protein SAMN06297251_10815 [Fulvimarina manganoxydans]|uniref:Uncharacterized protein n=1 Tax=Fulvimarina manganoxydans TaxID=937218 RepID=A0A1W2BY31_9HYPH|nr:hypothetical protein [Fulvimarina manganoxydans]MCK5931686.1 hypothetical protein [Fulvimarina manganoxydans]SMC77791.1 hypothetical protein SAMN06297251_10815 [Fulvimarina manganoxydans]